MKPTDLPDLIRQHREARSILLDLGGFAEEIVEKNRIIEELEKQVKNDFPCNR